MRRQTVAEFHRSRGDPASAPFARRHGAAATLRSVLQADSSVRDRPSWRGWAVVLGVATLSVLLGLDSFADAAALHAIADRPTSPYLTTDAFWLLRCWIPLVSLAAFALVLSPGLLGVAALGTARTVTDWLGQGFALSLVLVSVSAALADAAMGEGVRGVGFAGVCLALSVLGVVATALRPDASAATWRMAVERREVLATSAVIVLGGLALLAPKIHWETFNGDGAHTFLAAKLLLFQPLPFWPDQAGAISGFPGLNTHLCLYPASWFIRLFGEYEAAVRLPMFLAMPWLFAGLVSAIEVVHDRILRGRDLWGLWLGVVAFTLTLAFNATYDPYSSDIALPAAQDILLMALWLFTVVLFLERRLGWMAFYAALTFSIAANGLLMLAFWIVAAVLCIRPVPVRAVAGLVAAIVGVGVATAFAPAVLEAFGQPAPGSEHGLSALLRRFAFIQLTDLRRFLFVVVPCGILPAIALVAWRRQDGVARAFGLFTLGYFAFFYFQAYVSLHYFVPVMVTPLVVFWRTELWTGFERWRGAAVAAAGLLACWLALPQHGAVTTAARQIGAALEDRLPGYEMLDPAAIRRADLLHALLPSDWRPEVPHESYGGSPLAWYYYSRRADVSRTADAAYVIDAPGLSEGGRVLRADPAAALYLADPARLESHRALRPGTPAGGTLYDIPRSMLFLGMPADDGPRVWSVIDVLEGFGIDSNRLLDMLGVERPD